MGKDIKQAVFLVVDDHEAMRQVTATQLRALGVDQIITASNGHDALQILQRQGVDIVVSDWYMPQLSGLELLREIRANPRLANLPFVMITAETERERVIEAINSGVNDLLIKPYTAARLGERIRRALSGEHLRPVKPGKSVAKPASEPPLASLLIVDDAPDNLHLLSHLFRSDYRVRVATSGEKALEVCFSDDPPDLVLLDVMMPGMDGFEVARRMRTHPGAETIPIIFVSAINGEEARATGMALGAVDFVKKPINPDLLRPRVRNFLRYVALRKRLQADFDSMVETARLRESVEQITRHDIKGPLAGVIGIVQSLIADAGLERDEELRRLRLAEESALQALDLINLSAEIFKIESGSFELRAQPFAIVPLLNRAAEIACAALAGKRLSFAIDAGESGAATMVQGDMTLSYSLFQNLLKNACEAAPAGSALHIAIDASAADRLAITISNQGALPPEMRARFFDKFATAGKSGGSGLGTYSAKLLCEAQGGEIALAACDAASTAVTVRLPRPA